MVCLSKRVKRFGKTRQNKQRFRCNQCFKTFVWKEQLNKRNKQRRWFELWVKESLSIRFLSEVSSHSQAKIKRIKNYWLAHKPKEIFDFSQYKYLIYDGTYFYQDGCFISLMCAESQKTIAHIYAKKEGYKSVVPWFTKLKQQGLYPLCITMDGERSVIRAIREVWPLSRIQRCLYHIQREGMRWLRTYPKTQAGKELRRLLKKVCFIETFKDQAQLIQTYQAWLRRYKKFVLSLPKNQVAFKDLKKTMVLINNALPDMFHYLDEARIHKTTNGLESFHSRLKSDYYRHRGLTKVHRISYLNWYCYFKNQQN